MFYKKFFRFKCEFGGLWLLIFYVVKGFILVDGKWKYVLIVIKVKIKNGIYICFFLIFYEKY